MKWIDKINKEGLWVRRTPHPEGGRHYDALVVYSDEGELKTDTPYGENSVNKLHGKFLGPLPI